MRIARMHLDEIFLEFRPAIRALRKAQMRLADDLNEKAGFGIRPAVPVFDLCKIPSPRKLDFMRTWSLVDLGSRQHQLPRSSRHAMRA